MRRFAFLTMVLAWVLYGAAGAFATCPMCASMAMASPAPSMASVMPDMPDMAVSDDSGASHASDHMPCDITHASFCVACLVVPPDLVTHDGRRLAPAYPSPDAVRPLRDARASPIPPPPRLV